MLADSELPSALCSKSPSYWADFSGIVLANSDTFSFKDREYQVEPMDSKSQVICVRKATGLGFSEIFILRTLWGCIYRKYKQGVLYLFPNDDDMQGFSKSRFGPLIKANRPAIGRYVKSVGAKSTDTASLKRIGTSSLFMDGARLTQVVGGEVSQKESAALRSKQVDCVIYDERDLMDDDVEDKARGRMGNSDLKEEVFISNPTIPDIGIDRKYQQSDQRMWFRRCGCGEWTCPDEYFPDLIGIDDNGKGYCACKKCGKPLGFNGQWVAKRPDIKGIEGYHISHLSSSKNDPYKILQKYRELTETGGNIADFYKLVLGLPYVAAEDKLTVNVVMACCGQNIMEAYSAGPCAAGVDIGKIKHVIIGQRVGNNMFLILKVARVSDMRDVHDLFRRFGVVSAVIDIRPYEDEVRQFQRAEYNIKIYLCEYSDNPMQEVVWNNNNKTVKVYRTGVFDGSHRLIADKKMTFPRKCPEMDEFALQLCNTAKVLETNKKSGTSVYRYRKLGDEHYRNALNYFVLAAGGSKIRTVNPYGSRPRQQYAIHNTVKI